MEKPLAISHKYLEEPIVAFYTSECADSEGRMIEEIWAWDYQRLEYVHNFIQWLFPLKHRSSVNQNAPLVNDRVIEAFTTNEQLRARLRKSLDLMLTFYGLQCVERADGNVLIAESDEYEERKPNWISPGNHNFLRLTRILVSLGLLGLEQHARALFKCLDRIYKQESRSIGNTTYSFWKNAIRSL